MKLKVTLFCCFVFLLVSFGCDKKSTTEPQLLSILGKWNFITALVNNQQTFTITEEMYINFTETLVSFFLEGWTEGRGLVNDECRGSYTRTSNKINITWNSTDDEEAANDYIESTGSVTAQLDYSLNGNNLILQCTIEGDHIKYTCSK